MKKFKSILFCLMAIMTMSLTVAFAADWLPSIKTMGVSMAAVGSVYAEIWTGELVGQLNVDENGTFLDGIDSYDQYVGNNVIHLVEAGIEPDVLLNNTTYPIPLQQLDDTDISISLDKFQTKVTPITDDELYAISYDKIKTVKTKHGNAITRKKLNKAIHAFAPQSNTVKTPVIFTSGSDMDEATGRVRLTTKDIVEMKKRFDILEIPAEGRRLVLCPDHVNDLLLNDQKFKDQYYNYTTGQIAKLYGFEIYEYTSCPTFTVAGVKKSLGAIAGEGEFQASVAMYIPYMFKAKGGTKVYWAPAENDPEYQRNKINFRHMFIALPKIQKAIGAIASKYVKSS